MREIEDKFQEQIDEYTKNFESAEALAIKKFFSNELDSAKYFRDRMSIYAEVIVCLKVIRDRWQANLIGKERNES